MGNYSYNNMAQSKEVYRLSRLKDQRVDVTERLKLARKLWYTDDDVGPNKHQVIIDAIITILINNKKRPELSEQLEEEVWQTLSALLNSSGITDTPGQHPTVSLRPTIAQVMVETLERERLAERAGEPLDTMASVLDCCRCVLTTPSLAPVLTSRLDILVSLCSVLCHLAMSRPATDTCLPTVLLQVTTNLWHHHHRSQLPPSQVLQLVTDKLLEVVMALTFHVRQSQAGCPHATTAASLTDLVLTIMFHESHQKLIKAYLDNVIQPKKAAQVSRTVSNIFNTLAAPLHQKTVGEKKKLKGENLVHRDVALCFLPSFFRHAVNAWKQRSQLSFQLFVCLTSYLGVPADKEGGGQTSKVAMETDSVGVLRQLLSVVRERSVYNVAADRAEGETQLQFFKRVLDALLSAPLCEEQCGCLVELLALNHMILEPCLPALMSHCCPGLPQMDAGCRAGVDTWLSQVVSTYTQLHQLPRFYDAVLQMTAQSPWQLIHTLPLPAFAHSLCSAVTSLAHSTAMELWGRLHEEILSVLQRVVDENHTDADMERLWASCLLFHQYLNNLRVSDWCKIASVGERIGGLISQLENSLVDPLLRVVQTCKSKSMLRAAALLLAVCLGDVKLTLADFRSSHITLPLPTTHQLPFSVQPQKLCRKKMKTDLEAVVRYLGDVLTTQRLRLLQVEGNDADWLQQLSDIMVWDDDDGHCQCHWDGQVCSVNINTYCVAKSHLLVCRSPSLLPPLLHHADQLAECVVHILSQPNLQPSSEHVRHTCRSVVRRLLAETSLMCLTSEERSKFQHQTVRCLWRRFFASDCPLPSPIVAVVMKLADACSPGARDEAEELTSVMTSLEELLLSPDVHTFTLSDSQLALLQVLEELPLSTFTPASRLLCTVSLLLVLSHLDGRGVSGSGARGWDVAWGLLLGLLESSVLRCLTPSTLLTCLKCLAAKGAVSEDACVGQVLKKGVVMVMGDVESLLHLEAFVAELERALKKMTRLVTKKKIDMNQSQHRSVLTLTHYIIKESHKHLRKDSSRKDVHSAYQQHFERLSSAVEEVVDAFEQQQTQFSLPPLLLQCFTAATAQRCISSAQEREPLTAKQRQRIEFVLSTLCQGQKESQGISWQKERLDFIACLYHHHNALPDVLTSPHTHTLWTSLLSSLHGNCATAEAEEGQWRLDVDDLRAQVRNRKRRLQEGDRDVHDKRRKLGDGRSRVVGWQNPKTPDSQGTGRGEGEVVGKEDGGRRVGGQGASVEQEWEKMMVDTMATVLASCRVSLFTELLQEVVTSMASGVRGSLLVWQRVVTCNSLSVEQRKLLESFCLTVVEQCVQVMQKLHGCAHNEGEVMGAVPVLHCVTAMLSQHKLLSTKGTVLCLLCASLAPLSHGGYEQFLSVVRAVCDAVHAVLVHHPHTAHALLHVVLPIASSVMKECVRRGDQKVLLANPEHIRPMTSCAEQVHRLVTLLVGGGEVQRVVATLVSDYTTTVQSLTLLPEVKKWLVSCMYACLDACDQHAVRQLQQRLPPGVRDMLHMLHNDYVSYHKYTGKV